MPTLAVGLFRGCLFGRYQVALKGIIDLIASKWISILWNAN